MVVSQCGKMSARFSLAIHTHTHVHAPFTHVLTQCASSVCFWRSVLYLPMQCWTPRATVWKTNTARPPPQASSSAFTLESPASSSVCCSFSSATEAGVYGGRPSPTVSCSPLQTFNQMEPNRHAKCFVHFTTLITQYFYLRIRWERLCKQAGN